MPYQTLDHTSELSLKVTGNSLEGLFSAALAGTMHILKKPFSSDKLTTRRSISLTAPDRTSLLIDFLNEALYLAYTHKEIYPTVKFHRLEDQNLLGTLKGFSVDSFNNDIKAVTYHQANVHQNKTGEWETKIIFDI